MRRALDRMRYRLLAIWGRGDDLNRRVTVENRLFAAAASGKGLTPDQCRELAVKLGVPSWVRRA